MVLVSCPDRYGQEASSGVRTKAGASLPLRHRLLVRGRGMPVRRGRSSRGPEVGLFARFRLERPVMMSARDDPAADFD